MAFSFYASLKAIPAGVDGGGADLSAFGAGSASSSWNCRYGAIGLVWNSMVSVAGGWFFLMACEMFVLGKRDFRLPGLGSYLQSAGQRRRHGRDPVGDATMIAVIVLIDQLLWRPVIAWADKFKFEQVESAERAANRPC